jgi:HlyD family secretion protein
VAAAEAGVAEAKATLEDAKSQLDRKRALAKTNVVSSQDLETAAASYHKAEAALESARAAVAAARADLNLNETDLEKTCICSPIKGVVLTRNVDPGQVVAASLQAPVLFTIAEDLSKMEVQVDVDEADVGQVKEGQPAVFTVDAYPNRNFQAHIQQVRYGSEVVQGVVTYKAVLATDNSELLLRPGMTATAEITVHRETNALTVSNEALRFTPPVAEPQDSRSFLQKLLPGFPHFRRASTPVFTGTERDIWVLRDGEPEKIRVTIGATDGERTAITKGKLKAGDKVIVDATTTQG